MGEVKWAVFTRRKGQPDLLNEESIAHSESASILKFMAENKIQKSMWDRYVQEGRYKCKKLPR